MKIIHDPINRKQSLLTFCAFILVKKRVYVLNTPYVFPLKKKQNWEYAASPA